MDIRVESLVASIHDYRDECKKKLDLIRDNLKSNLDDIKVKLKFKN